jgi:hypothetical protein
MGSKLRLLSARDKVSRGSGSGDKLRGSKLRLLSARDKVSRGSGSGDRLRGKAAAALENRVQRALRVSGDKLRGATSGCRSSGNSGRAEGSEALGLFEQLLGGCLGGNSVLRNAKVKDNKALVDGLVLLGSWLGHFAARIGARGISGG